MRYDVELEGWQNQNRPVTGPSFNWSNIEQTVLHYVGVKSFVPPSNIAAWLRNTHHYWLDTRGYSLGYNAAVVSHPGHRLDGTTWEIRGDRFRGAATGGTNHNTFAILLITRDDQPATPKAAEAVRRLNGQCWEHAGRPLRVRGHNTAGGTTQTSCPGVGLSAQITAGVFSPTAGDDDMRPFTDSVPRVVDTRSGKRPPAGATIVVPRHPNLPAEARSVLLSVTAVNSSAPSFVTVWRDGTRPTSSILNVSTPNTNVAGTSFVELAADGTCRVYTHAASHVVVDVMGWSPR